MHELHCSVAIVGVASELVGISPDCVLEHGSAHIVPVDDIQVGWLIQLAGVGVDCLQHLCVLIVDHGLGSVNVAVQQCRHIKGLLHEFNIAVWIDAVAAHSSQQLKLVAEAPVAYFLAFQIFDRFNPGVGKGDLQSGAALEYLADVGYIHALFAWHQASRHPRDGEVCATRVQDGDRHDLNCALQDFNIQAEVFIEALVDSSVVAGELRLGEPLQLQSDRGHLHRLGGRRSGSCRGDSCIRCGRRGRIIIVVIAAAGCCDQSERQDGGHY